MEKRKKKGIIVGMVLRNRLIALLLRIAIFVLMVISLPVYMAYFETGWLAISTFSVELAIAYLILVGFEIIFNLIDLLRHGIHGVAAGPYMPIGMPITVFSIISGILYFSALLPNGAAPAGAMAILLHVVLIAGPLLDWLMLDEKGTVTISSTFSWQIYPVLFHIFGYFRTVIWPDDPIYRGNMYALPFLNYLDPNIVIKSIAFFAITLGGSVLAVLINEWLSGKYRRLTSQID